MRRPALSLRFRLALLALLALAAGCRGDRDRPAPAESEVRNPNGTARTAALACQRFVQRRLRGPRAVRFSDDSNAVSIAPAHFHVVSYVEAVGTPGGANRFAYTCDVTKVKNGSGWRLDALTIK